MPSKSSGRRLHGRRGLKSAVMLSCLAMCWSPPSRAAWIEIDNYVANTYAKDVAAFTGGVD